MQATGSRWRALLSAPAHLKEPGARLTNELVTALILLVILAGLAVTVARLLVEPGKMAGDLPVVGLTLCGLLANLALARSRFAGWAPLVFSCAPIWTNAVEGLTRPNGPIWYGFMPLTALLGGVLLPLRQALWLTALSLVGVVVVVWAGAEQLGAEKGLTIVLYVAVTSALALGLAVFRQRVEDARRVEVERLSAQLAATERLESIGRLAGGVAHDFNNLLTVMLTGAEAARQGHADALDDVISAGERAAQLTGQLLAFSRHRGGERVNVVVDEVIASVQPLLRRLLPENIELRLELGAGAAVLLEEQQLEQLLFNLAANARDAMRAGGRLVVATSVQVVPQGAAPPRLAGEFVVLELRDTGEGMAEEVRAHVFEPFFTTKRPGAGTGLGLAMVHGIVRRAGGWLALESEVGHGTRVTLALPRATEPAPERAARVDAVPRFSGLALVVEDEPLVMRATSRALSGLGFTVSSAGGVAEVPSVLAGASGPLAVLVTDVVMPGQGGVELVDWLRQRQPGLPVLLVSGYADEDLQRVLRQPATGFLAKPFTERTLAAALQALLPK